MNSENTGVSLQEGFVIIKKFMGDGPPDRQDEPFEEIVFYQGNIVKYLKRGDD